VSVWLLGENEWDGMFARTCRGMFARNSLFGAAIIIPDDDIFNQSIVKHELAHYVLDAYIRDQPRWFGEGMAQYLETIEYRRAGNDAVVTVGEWAPYRTSYRSDLFNSSPTNLLRTSEMLTAPRRAAREDFERELRFYTTAWLMIQYLVNTHREGLEAFERDLMAGLDANLAFAHRFPDLSGDRFDDGLYAFVSRGGHLVREFHIPPAEYKSNTRELTEAELHTIRARIDAVADTASALDERSRLARLTTNLDEAKAADPMYLDALALDLAVLHRPTTPESARHLVAANPDNWLAWYVAAAAFSTSPAFAVDAANARRKQILLHPSVAK
jgi:arsenate reductase-like glutaredoxin family protein